MAVNKLLAALCIVQFAIISIWLADTTRDKGLQIDKEIKNPIAIPFIPEVTSLAADAKAPWTAPYVGAAVAVMLHSPKWFQRRYTVMLQNVYNNLPAHWVLQVFYIRSGGSQIGVDINPGIKRMVDSKKIILTEIPAAVAKGKKRRSDFFLAPWLWETVLAEKVLLFGGNTVLCSNSPVTIDNFSSFDYIGPPWSAHDGYGGSGEISLRSRSVMLRIIRDQLKIKNITKDFTNEWGPEDHFFVERIKKLVQLGEKLKIATKEDSKLFAAADGYFSLDVLGASGTLAGLTDAAREEFFAFCPELKILFPSLHNPGCFGANLKPDLCRNSICALDPKKKSC